MRRAVKRNGKRPGEEKAQVAPPDSLKVTLLYSKHQVFDKEVIDAQPTSHSVQTG